MPDRLDRSAAHDLSEDALGFGRLELRTARDVVARPAAVLEAWMTQGPTGGGVYARPLRLYLALNAVLMVILFLKGGAGFLMADLPPPLMEDLVARSGKSRDAFLGDADNWMTFVMVPILSLSYAAAAAPLFRAWDPDALGWRRGFRAAFAWLCAWTVPMVPLAWWSFGRGPLQAAIALALFVLGVIAFLRMGRGRWYRSTGAGVIKAVALSLVVQVSAILGSMLVLAIGIAGALAAA